MYIKKKKKTIINEMLYNFVNKKATNSFILYSTDLEKTNT